MTKRLEEIAREAGLSHGERACLRQLKSRDVLAALQQKILKLRQAALPKSAVGKACDYALNQWPRLIVYVNHGEVEIDNNWCENAMRPMVLGRKNWLHIGSPEAGPHIVAISSVIETCISPIRVSRVVISCCCAGTTAAVSFSS